MKSFEYGILTYHHVSGSWYFSSWKGGEHYMTSSGNDEAAQVILSAFMYIGWQIVHINIPRYDTIEYHLQREIN